MLFFIISLYLIQYWEAVLSALRIRNTNSEGYVICPGLSVRKQQALDLNSFWLQILVLPLLHTHPFPPVKEPYTWSSASQWPHYFLQAGALLLLFLVGENVTDNTSARDWMYDMTLRPDWWARSPSPSLGRDLPASVYILSSRITSASVVTTAWGTQMGMMAQCFEKELSFWKHQADGQSPHFTTWI